MSMLRICACPALAAALLSACASTVGDGSPTRYGLGRPLTDRELAGWNIDVNADGKGLPPGSGSVARGQAVYESKCATCHGAKGEGKPANPLVGGTMRPPDFVKTVGSYWPYATTLFDYVNRAMPWDRPQSLTADDVYAVSAYILYLNGIVPASQVLDASSLPRVRMPNRDGFTTDPRPDTR